MEEWKKYILTEDQRLVVEELSHEIPMTPNEIVQTIFEKGLGIITASRIKDRDAIELMLDILIKAADKNPEIEKMFDLIHEHWEKGKS